MGEILTMKQRKARKEHKCTLCGSPILPGREYMYYSWVNDCRISEGKFHIHCDAMLDVFMTEFCFDDEYDYDDAACALREEGCEKVCTYEEREECTLDLFSCERCLRKLLPPTVLGAALRSVQENKVDET